MEGVSLINEINYEMESNAADSHLHLDRSEDENLDVSSEGSVPEPKGMDSSHELYHRHSFVPPAFSRLPPDGDEFPNSWADEENGSTMGCDPKKLYDMKMITSSLPPPIPASEPPAEDEAPPPLPTTVPPPKAPLTRRSSSVEDRKRLLGNGSSNTGTSVPMSTSFKLPSPMPRGQEPSKKSVKDKIAMFSRSSSIEEGPAPPTPLGHMNGGSFRSSTSSLPRSSATANGTSNNSFSKSSENLLNGSLSVVDGLESAVNGSPGIDKWKITQSTFDLRKNPESLTNGTSYKTKYNLNSEPASALNGSSRIGERSQSMLDVGGNESPSYQRLGSVNRHSYNLNTSNSNLKQEFGVSASLMEQRRRANLSKLRGLVIPDKQNVTNGNSSVSVVDLPTIISKDAVLSYSKPPEQKPRSSSISTSVARPESFDSTYKEKSSAKLQSPSAGDSDSDWKLPTCPLPKYSPAFKRRSLTPYQSPLQKPVTAPFVAKVHPVSFNNGPTSYKLTPEPKSLESLASPHSDSSFEFNNGDSSRKSRSPLANDSNGSPHAPSLNRRSSFDKPNSVPEAEITQPMVEKQRVMPVTKSTNDTKYNGKGKLEDSDNDSAVSSSRSSISHGLSPPNSPTPEESSSTPDPERNATHSPNECEEAEADDSANSDEGWRVLKPQSVEAINRKNVLTSAKFSSGVGAGRAPEDHKNHRRSDDEEAGYADAEAEDTESSCSELDISSHRRRSSMTNRLTQLRRSAATAKADTEEEEDAAPTHSTPSHSPQSSVDVNEMILPELTESPLQAIFDMEVQMAYINEICDALPARSDSTRYFSRRDSETTVIERPIVKERKSAREIMDTIDNSHNALIVPTVSQSAADRRSRNRSSSGNESDFSSSVSYSSQSQSGAETSAVTSSMSSMSTSLSGSVTTLAKPAENGTSDKWTMLEKKYSKSLTSVNLLGSATKPKPVVAPVTTVNSKFTSSNVGIEKAIDKMLLDKTIVDSKNKTVGASMPRGRNDFKSLSEKWQQISTDGPPAPATPTTVTKPAGLASPKPLPKPMVAEKPSTASPVPAYRTPIADREVPEYVPRKTMTSTPVSGAASVTSPPSTPEVPAVTTPVTSTRKSSLTKETLSQQDKEMPAEPEVRSRAASKAEASPAVSSPDMHLAMSSTKRSVSVNDIRRAFEKAEIAVNSYGREENCGMKSTAKDPSGLSLPSAHFRVSSFDSTTSEDSSATTPASGIYGSVNSLVSSAPRDPYGSITSLASSTSLISPQELQQLIDEANQSLEEAGTPSHEVCVIILHREYAGGSLGITLAGGADYETKEITVHKVLTGSIADRDGRVHRGDRVLSINGKSTKGLTHREALTLLKAPRTEVVLVVSRGRSGTNGFQTIEESCATTDRTVEPLGNPEGDDDGNFKWGPIKTAVLVKDGAGLGFSLEGGKGSIHGDKPLTVKKIFVGGPAEKSGELNVGDLIVSIMGVNMSSKSRTEAWNFMKKLGDGEVKINVRSPTS